LIIIQTIVSKINHYRWELNPQRNLEVCQEMCY